MMTTVAVILCCTSCIRVNLSELRTIKPSDNIVKNEYKMEPFTKVDVDIMAKVKFVQSADGDYRVLMKCPDNYVELFEFKVDDGELSMAFADASHSGIDAKEVAIIVRTPTLEMIQSEGLGSIIIDSLKTPSLHLDSEGVGNINIKGLTTQKLTVESSGVGNIELKGETHEAEYECSGVGNIDAIDMKAAKVKAEINGVGSVTCYASKRIKGEINGVGSLTYGGQPEQKDIQRNGVGKITEEK